MANEEMMEVLSARRRQGGGMSQSLSYSRARLFSECPASFEAIYEKRQKIDRTEPHLIMGSLVHEVCDRYVKLLQTTGQSSDFDSLNGIAGQVWTRPPEGVTLSEAYRPEYDALIERVRDALIFERIEDVHASEMKIAVDRQWKPVAYDSAEAFVRGKIDRIDMDEEGNLLVVDYKSGHRVDSIEATMQTPLYARMVKAHFEHAQSVDAMLIYLRHGVEKRAQLNEESMERAKVWIEAIDAAITRAREQKHWPARPGQACRGCPVFKTCPARERAIKIVPPNDEAEADALLERLILVEREREEIRAALAVWVDQFGGVEAGGMIFGFKPQVQLDFDTRAVAAILEARGLRVLDFMRPDKEALKKLARRDRGLQSELDAIAVDASKTLLSLSRTGE